MSEVQFALGHTSAHIIAMAGDPESTPQSFGVAAAITVATLSLAYAVVLAAGLVTLPSPTHQIQEPWFTLMEVLILAIAPAMVAFLVAIHCWVPRAGKGATLAAVAFMGMCAALTCVVHFTILTLSRHPSFRGQEWASTVFSFQWPSLAYALDILAWDVFFPLSALFAACAIRGDGLVSAVRFLLYASAALAFVGLLGLPLASMQVRNAGIIGYVVVFPLAAALMARVFRQHSDDGKPAKVP